MVAHHDRACRLRGQNSERLPDFEPSEILQTALRETKQPLQQRNLRTYESRIDSFADPPPIVSEWLVSNARSGWEALHLVGRGEIEKRCLKMWCDLWLILFRFAAYGAS